MRAQAAGASLRLSQSSTRPLPPARLPSLRQRCLGRSRRTSSVTASASASPDQPSSSDGQWWDQLKRGSISGPDHGGSLGLGPNGAEGETGSLAELLLGTKGYAEMEAADRAEAQRIWDAMRASAWERYKDGRLPEWIEPGWLMQEEAPINRMLRLEREAAEGGGEEPSSSGGDGSDGGSGRNNGGNGGFGFWREDDPYWPLRNWGDHPMRWWTFGFAALLAIGGVATHAFHGSAESLWVGGIMAAVLSMTAMGMSDMTDWGHGPLAVKVAWAACALLAAKEYFFGWSFRRVPTDPRLTPWPEQAAQAPPRLGWCGFASVLMCTLYMWTGMAELDEWALPPNPGSVYKNGDVAYKHMVAKKWGFGKAPLRS